MIPIREPHISQKPSQPTISLWGSLFNPQPTLQRNLKMIISENTPTRDRVILEEVYTKAGQPDFEFIIPQPFTADMVSGVTVVGADPTGVAQQLNQVFTENLANNMAARIRAAVKAGTNLPNQSDMDKLIESYDFTGSRTRSISGTLFDRCFTRLAGGFVRKLLKRKGYQDMAAPVTVAKKGEATNANQIDFETFESIVESLVKGEGVWSENKAFIAARDALVEEARNEEVEIRRRESTTESKLSDLGL